MDWGEDRAQSWLYLALKDGNDSTIGGEERLCGVLSRGKGHRRMPEACLGGMDGATCNQKWQISAGTQCKIKWGSRLRARISIQSVPFNTEIRCLQYILWTLESFEQGNNMIRRANILVSGKSKMDKEKYAISSSWGSNLLRNLPLVIKRAAETFSTCWHISTKKTITSTAFSGI